MCVCVCVCVCVCAVPVPVKIKGQPRCMCAAKPINPKDNERVKRKISVEKKNEEEARRQGNRQH